MNEIRRTKLVDYDSDSDSSSDESINTILDGSRCRTRLSSRFDDDCMSVAGSVAGSVFFSNRTFDDEYYRLPPLENLSLKDVVLPSDLHELGVIQYTIDFVVTIKPLGVIPPLDYDTCIFDEKAAIIGKIFEIYGLVHEPMYGIRFNSNEEACQWSIGTRVFYAPMKQDVTFTVYPDDLMKLRYGDEGCDGEFSDDEVELSHNQKQRSKTRGPPDAALPIVAKKVRF